MNFGELVIIDDDADDFTLPAPNKARRGTFCLLVPHREYPVSAFPVYKHRKMYDNDELRKGTTPIELSGGLYLIVYEGTRLYVRPLR